MKRILVTGAGGAPSTNFIRSLRASPEKFFIVGTDADPYYLKRSEANVNYLVPKVTDRHFLSIINRIIKKESVTFIHIQNDAEVGWMSVHRERILAPMFLPSKQTVTICQDKFLSYQAWIEAGIRVPKTMLLRRPADLKKAVKLYGKHLWIRSITGAGGKWSLPVSSPNTAKSWIDFHNGWGHVTAAELLEPDSVTWMSVWHQGKLVVAQGRKRLYWEMAKVAPSGITGVTGAGVTVSDKKLDAIAQRAILAIDPTPHGLYGVDLTYDTRGIPNPTEINIGRFFTTHLFFTQAGVNFPYIYTKLGMGQNPPLPRRRINPLKPGLVWIRGVDFEPILTTEKEIENEKKKLKKLVAA